MISMTMSMMFNLAGGRQTGRTRVARYTSTESQVETVYIGGISAVIVAVKMIDILSSASSSTNLRITVTCE